MKNLPRGSFANPQGDAHPFICEHGAVSSAKRYSSDGRAPASAGAKSAPHNTPSGAPYLHK